MEDGAGSQNPVHTVVDINHHQQQEGGGKNAGQRRRTWPLRSWTSPPPGAARRSCTAVESLTNGNFIVLENILGVCFFVGLFFDVADDLLVIRWRINSTFLWGYLSTSRMILLLSAGE